MEKMQDLSKKKDELDVSSYQKYIDSLYSEINRRRDFADLYGYLHRNVGILGKSIRLEIDENHTVTKFVLPISWLFSLANKLGINVLEALIKKYPGICPYCLERKCVCYKTGKKPLRLIPVHQIKELMYYKWEEVNNSTVKFNLNRAVEFITDIFPNNEVIWRTYGPRDHMLKIHEEVTEVHEAFGSYMKEGDRRLDALKDEIADVFAWTLGAWGIRYPNDSLDDAFIDYYLEDCPECKSAPCRCSLHDSPPRSLPDFSKLNGIKESLEHLTGILPEYRKEFSDLINSYDALIATPNAPLTRQILTQTKEKLEDILRIISTIDIEGNSSAIIYSILNSINLVLKRDDGETVRMKQYDLFLSYSTANKDQASTIFNHLSKNKIVVFMSEKAIQPSSQWENVIRDAMKNSKMLCTLASPESLKSDWVRTEWDWALILEKPILPVLFRCSLKDLPEQLQRFQAIDFHEYPRITDIVKNFS